MTTPIATKLGYLAWHADAERRYKSGQRQCQCAACKFWFWPDQEHVCEAVGEMIADYKPRTPLGKRLLELRAAYAANGGKFLNREELDAEIASRRLGRIE